MPTPQDGTIEIPIEGNTMPTELPNTVAENLMAGLVGSLNLSGELSRNSTQEVNSILSRVSARKFDELGPVESRSVSGVVATPIASPTTQ